MGGNVTGSSFGIGSCARFRLVAVWLSGHHLMCYECELRRPVPRLPPALLQVVLDAEAMGTRLWHRHAKQKCSLMRALAATHERCWGAGRCDVAVLGSRSMTGRDGHPPREFVVGFLD